MFWQWHLVFDSAVALMFAAYALWVLAGTVAWVSHLGARVPSLQPWLPAGGAPLNPPAASVKVFFSSNFHLAFGFVLPHSVLRPVRLRRLVGNKLARATYSGMAAASLHLFLVHFVPLRSPVVMELPLAPCFHTSLSCGCLIFAMVTFVFDPATWDLLGVADAFQIIPTARAPPGMDAITWMGVTVKRWGGTTAFVLFTGLSILPQELTLGDCLTRGCAAVYLRLRSRAFRRWLANIEGAHLFTWALRLALLIAALCSASRWGDGNRQIVVLLGAAGVFAATLRLAEQEGAVRCVHRLCGNVGRFLLRHSSNSMSWQSQ